MSKQEEYEELRKRLQSPSGINFTELKKMMELEEEINAGTSIRG